MQRPITSTQNSTTLTTATSFDPIFTLLTKDLQTAEHQLIETAFRLISANSSLNGNGISQAALDHDVKTAHLVAELELDGYYRAASLLISSLAKFPGLANNHNGTILHPRMSRLLAKLAEIYAYTHSQDYSANFNLKSEEGYETIRNCLLQIVCNEEQAILLEIASQTTRLQEIEEMPLNNKMSWRWLA
jgi:hypothetical protein